MPFQKGHQKHGGRKSGTHNKITNDVRALLDSLGVNPLEGMARIAKDHEQSNPQLAGRMHAELAKYVHPQLKAIEHSGPGGGPIVHEHTTSALELLRGRIAGVAERTKPN
jgi:hypothetical protein